MARKRGEDSGGSSSKDLYDLASLVIIGFSAYYIYQNPSFLERLGGLFSGFKLPALPAPSGGGSTPKGGDGGGGGGAVGKGGLDKDGISLPYKTTGKMVAMGQGSAHRNGQRYNVNRKFPNHMIIGYYKTSSGQEAIGHKTDGPNRGGCSSSPECRWIDPDLNLSNCTVKYGAEFPHPKANDLKCPSCVSCGQNLSGKWVGTASLVYGPPGDRWRELWVDPGGLVNNKPANKWKRLLKENYTKQIPAKWQRTAHPTNFDAGFEAEIRMRGAQGTEMKFAKVYEIVV